MKWLAVPDLELVMTLMRPWYVKNNFFWYSIR